MRKVLLYLLVGTFWLGVGLTPCSAEEGTLDSINVSVDFKSDTDLKYALQIISVLTGLSIIPDDDVTGKVTARFIDQPVSKVLERILEVNDCEYKLVDDIIRVVRIPVISKVFPLKFALALEIGESLESLLLLSPEGSIQVDEEVNSLLVSDKRPYLEEIARFIQELDSAEKQLRSQSFSPQFLRAEKLASLIKDHLSSKGEIKIYPSTNSLLITETSFHLTKITSLVQSLDTFQPEKKVFPLKFALASDMEKLIKGYLSPEGALEVNEERNELVIMDASYYLEKVGNLVADLDTLEKQIRKESFPIKYARIKDLALLLRENLSSKGNLEVDEERSLISIEDSSYYISRLGKLIQEEDSFIPKKKRYYVKFAPLILVAEEAEEILSDKGTLEIEEDTSSFVVSDVEKNLEKIEKLVRKMDTLEAQLIPPLVFQDEDLMEALRTISQTTGVSMVVDPGVEGKVNLIFGHPTALLKVLPQILEPNDCRYETIGDTIRVIPIPLFKMVFPLKFALASEIASSLESLLLLSPKGTIQVDEEVNSLLVRDKRPYLEEIASFIQGLDSAEKQLRSKSFSPQFLRAEKLTSLIKGHLSDKGKIETYPSTNSLLITETSYHLRKITSLVQSLDTFQPEKKVFPLKFALASDMEKTIKGYLSPDGTLEMNEERNELAVTDTPYYLEKAGNLLADLDSPEKQIRKESFPIKYARIKDVERILEENRSPQGQIEVDEERSLINIEDTSFYLFKLERLIQKEDSFIPKKKRYYVKFTPLILVAEEAEEILSDKGELEIQEDTSSLVVNDVEKNLEKIEKLVNTIDNLEDQLITKKYFLTYLTPEEAHVSLQNVITSYGEIRLPKVRGTGGQTQEKEEYILIPREEPAPRETVSERVLERQLSEPGSEELLSLEEGETEDNVIYVTDLKRNIPNIDALITYLNGAETASQIITKTFYIQEGSLERMALAMANILGINPDDIEGLDPKGEWMEMKVQTLEIELGTVGPK